MRRLVLAIVLLGACSDDEGGPIDIDDLQTEVINTYCNLYVRCGLIDDLATCRTIYTDLEIDKDLVAAVDAGKVHYDPDKARECLASVSGSCERNQVNLGENNAACDETFSGTVGAGGQCAIDEECLSQNCDVPSCPDACCQGTCVGDAPTPRPKVGESCAMTFSCSDSFCDTTTMICTAYRALGEACTTTSQCAQGSCTNSVCTAYPGEGEPCNATSTTSACSEVGLICSQTSNTCVAVGLTGDPCTTSRDCSPIYMCGAAGTCQLRPRLGEACSQATGSCIDHSYCEPTTMTCTAPKADGQPCGSDRECTSNNCDQTTTTCTTPPICI
jgi:hypothetical protein